MENISVNLHQNISFCFPLETGLEKHVCPFYGRTIPLNVIALRFVGDPVNESVLQLVKSDSPSLNQGKLPLPLLLPQTHLSPPRLV